MADVVERNNNGFLYFIVGVLVVAVAVIAYIALANGGGNDADISVDLPAVDAPDLPAPGGDLDVEINTSPAGQ